jgi:hypothetical protein
VALTEAGASGESRPAARLLDHLPAECRRVLLLGDDGSLATAVRERCAEVVTAGAAVSPATLAALGDEVWGRRDDGGAWQLDAALIVHDVTAPPHGLDAVLRALHPMVAEKGRLLLAVPSTGRPPAAARQPAGVHRPGGPAAEHAAPPPVGAGAGPETAAAVVALSEAGFVVTRQEHLAEPPADQGGGSGSGLDLLVARRDGFRVREYRSGDEVQILPIFEGSFHVRRSLERWSWEYRENPHGNLTISVAFDQGGQMVAHYAGYPVRFRDGGERLPQPALQVGDTFTLPAVRHVGRGPTSLLGRTVRHFYARFCAGRVAFNYGFNTGNIQRFSMAFVGARRLEDIPFYVLPLPERRPPPPSRLERAFGGWRVERVERFDARWDAFFDSVAPAHGMLVERDARYLDWRYARCPDAPYVTFAAWRRGRLAGWATFRRRDDRLRWGDALVDPDHAEPALRALLAAALDLPEHGGVGSVETWVSPRPAWWRQQLVALGFEPRPEPDDLGLVFVPFGLDPEVGFRDRLYYTMGDSDLF